MIETSSWISVHCYTSRQSLAKTALGFTGNNRYRTSKYDTTGCNFFGLRKTIAEGYIPRITFRAWICFADWPRTWPPAKQPINILTQIYKQILLEKTKLLKSHLRGERDASLPRGGIRSLHQGGNVRTHSHNNRGHKQIPGPPAHQMNMQSTSSITKNAKRLEDPEQPLVEILDQIMPARTYRDNPFTTERWTQSRIKKKRA